MIDFSFCAKIDQLIWLKLTKIKNKNKTVTIKKLKQYVNASIKKGKKQKLK